MRRAHLTTTEAVVMTADGDDRMACAGFGCESFQFVCGLSAPSEGAIDLAALEL